MKFHQLRDVIAIADSGSLRAASRQLRVAQSAITKSIRLLEKELDVQLFERSKRGAVLTPMGILFVQRARAASNQLSRAREEIAQHRGLGVGRVTVSLSTVPHLGLMSSVIVSFNTRYPDVRLTILEALGFHSVEPQMRSGEVDAYVGIAPVSEPSSEYIVESLFNNPRYVIGRIAHPLARATSLSELTDARWVVSSHQTAETSFAALFRQHNLRVPPYITLAAGTLSQLVILLNSETLAIAPKQVLEFPLFAKHFVRVPVREDIGAPSIVIIRRVALPLTPAAEYFCSLIRRTSSNLVSSSRRSKPPKHSKR